MMENETVELEPNSTKLKDIDKLRVSVAAILALTPVFMSSGKIRLW